jgi:acyl-CoA thioesterase I
MMHRLLKFVLFFRYVFKSGFVNAVPALMVLLCTLPVSAEPEIRILVLGDSLTAGYGLAEPDGFPAQLERALRKGGTSVRVLNAGVSGDTTAGGLARLEWSLATKPHAVVIELGANDGLRGLNPKATAANLDGIVSALKRKGLAVLLAGMRAPPNLGADYGKEFNNIFGRIAAKHKIALYPFFLEGVATHKNLNQADGIHPNAQGVDVIVGNILPYIRSLISRAQELR